MVWNTVVTEVVTTGDCLVNGMEEVVKKFKCAKYLPKCVDMVGCYVSEVTNDALDCGSGFVSPSVECLKEAGFAQLIFQQASSFSIIFKKGLKKL